MAYSGIYAITFVEILCYSNLGFKFMPNFIDYIIAYQELLGFIAAALGAISFIPQLLKIWRFRSARDISIGMYVIYAISVILWLIYGVVIKSAPLILSEILTLTLVSAILIMKYIWR